MRLCVQDGGKSVLWFVFFFFFLWAERQRHRNSFLCEVQERGEDKSELTITEWLVPFL